MSNTGTYVYDAKAAQVVKVSDEIPSLARPVYFNKGGVPMYDASAQQSFDSKQEKRAWLQQHGLREGGIVNPDKRLEGHATNATRPSLTQKAQRQAKRAALQQQVTAAGGVMAFYDQLQQGG